MQGGEALDDNEGSAIAADDRRSRYQISRYCILINAAEEPRQMCTTQHLAMLGSMERILFHSKFIYSLNHLF